jgi:uncharacterized cupin superfamily protein
VPPLIHWDDPDIAFRDRDSGHIGGRWHALGEAAGSDTVGLVRMVVPAGRSTTPAHRHGHEEEIFFVLAGAGISWQDGRCYDVRAGDCIVHPAATEAHTLRAGGEGLDVLVFGTRRPDDSAYLPRAGVAWLSDYGTWTEVGGAHPFEREAAAGPPPLGDPAERPRTIVAAADVPGETRAGATVARTRLDLGRAASSIRTGLKRYDVPPGMLATPPHCHSAEEELFVVLDGEGELLLGDDAHRLRRGHVVARPAGTGVSHTFRAGAAGLSFLAYGTREPNDICFYPRSNKVFLRGIGLVARLDGLTDYWDGED